MERCWRALENSPELLHRFRELAGRCLLCQCGPGGACLADALMEAFVAAYRRSRPCPRDCWRRGPPFRQLRLFAGPEGREGGFASWCQFYGASVVEYDIVNDPERQNLADRAARGRVVADIESNVYSGAKLDPPCNAFSVARDVPGGPPPLRGECGSNRDGHAELGQDDRERVRLGALLVPRACHAASLLKAQGSRGSWRRRGSDLVAPTSWSSTTLALRDDCVQPRGHLPMRLRRGRGQVNGPSCRAAAAGLSRALPAS